MLARGHRFHGYGSLKAVYGRGLSVRGQFINLKYTQRSATKPYRVAVVVSRKVHKSAVVRNRIRRRLYESVRRQSAGIPPGSDLVFLVYADHVADIDAQKLEQTIKELLQKASQVNRA